MGILNRFFKETNKRGLKCSVCSKADKTVHICGFCGKPFCKDHYFTKHVCAQTILKKVESVPKKIAPQSRLYDVHWERGRTKPTAVRDTPWNEFSQSYRNVVLGKSEPSDQSVYSCAVCRRVINTRTCSYCHLHFCKDHIAPEDHHCVGFYPKRL